MAIDLNLYSRIKDKCCIAYFGNCDEYLYQLLFFRRQIEFDLKGIELYIASRDCSFHHIQNHKNVLSMNDLRNRRLEFGFVNEVLSDSENHPIEKLLTDSSISPIHIDNDNEAKNSRCLIVSNGGWPTKSLSQLQIQKLMDIAISRGLRPEFGDSIENVGHVWGVESWQVWKKAEECQKGSLLVPTGIGENFYRRTFPRMEVNYLK